MKLVFIMELHAQTTHNFELIDSIPQFPLIITFSFPKNILQLSNF